MNEQKAQELLELKELSKNDDSNLQYDSNYFDQQVLQFNKFIIENDRTILPPDIEKYFWVFNDKELALSNFDNNDIKRIMLWFDIAKINYMMGIPDYKLTFDMMRDIDEMWVKTLAKIKRSSGGMERERALLATQIKEIRTPERKQAGFWGGVANIFRGGSR